MALYVCITILNRGSSSSVLLVELFKLLGGQLFATQEQSTETLFRVFGQLVLDLFDIRLRHTGSKALQNNIISTFAVQNDFPWLV